MGSFGRIFGGVDLVEERTCESLIIIGDELGLGALLMWEEEAFVEAEVVEEMVLMGFEEDFGGGEEGFDELGEKEEEEEEE